MFIIFTTLGNKATVFELYKMHGINQMLASWQDCNRPIVIEMAWSGWCSSSATLSHNFAFFVCAFQKIVKASSFVDQVRPTNVKRESGLTFLFLSCHSSN